MLTRQLPGQSVECACVNPPRSMHCEVKYNSSINLVNNTSVRMKRAPFTLASFPNGTVIIKYTLLIPFSSELYIRTPIGSYMKIQHTQTEFVMADRSDIGAKGGGEALHFSKK